MAKNKKKNKKHNKEKQQQNSSALNSSINIDESIQDINRDLPEGILPLNPQSDNLLKEIKSVLEQLKKKENEIEDHKKKLEEKDENLKEKEKELNDIENKFNTKKNELQMQKKSIESTEKKLLTKEVELVQREAKAQAGFLEEKEKIVKEIKKEFDDINQQYHIKSREILDRENKIEERESNAKAEFVKEQQEVIKDYEKKIMEKLEEFNLICQKIETKEEEHHKKIRKDLENFSLKNKEMSQELNDQIEKEQERLTVLEQKLENEKKQLERKNKELDIRKRSQKEWEDNVKKDIKESFQTEIKNKENESEKVRQLWKRDQKKIDELQNELSDFADLKSRLDGAGIQDVQDELEKNRKQIKELKIKLKAAPQKDLEEENESLKRMLEEKNDLITDLKTKNEEIKNDLHRMTMSVTEKSNLEERNRQLKYHNEILEKGLDDLKNTMDKLMDQHMKRDIFPALIQMDKDHNIDASNIQQVSNLKNFVNHLRTGLTKVYDKTPLYYTESDIRIFVAGLAMSQLHILHGFSGTGKTSLAKAFAKVVGGHCTDVSIQAGWRDRNDFIGYYNAFEKKFYENEALQGLYRAQQPDFEDRINVILMDEMNLAKPEYYFSDFLSALEKQPEEREIVLMEKSILNPPKKFIDGRKIKIPENVWFIGTANHDETTNEFADKTYDRAHVMKLSRDDKSVENCENYYKTTFSVTSLIEVFNKAQKKYQKESYDILEKLSNSTFKNILENNFSISWGPRFEQQAVRFIPVILESGGCLEDALDHLFVSKIFRRGKVTGRYTTTIDDLRNIEKALKDFCKDNKLTDFEKTLVSIEEDCKRMERGA